MGLLVHTQSEFRTNSRRFDDNSRQSTRNIPHCEGVEKGEEEMKKRIGIDVVRTLVWIVSALIVTHIHVEDVIVILATGEAILRSIEFCLDHCDEKQRKNT
jgi:hypothetical protein